MATQTQLASRVDFPIVRPKPGPDGRLGRTSLLIHCSICETEDTITTVDSAASGALEFVSKRFRAKGWTLGKSRDRDLCPSCTGRSVAPKKNKSNGLEELDKALDGLLDAAPTPAPTPIAEPQPSSADKRIIFQKLNETYTDEKAGYSRGWSDAAVAADLGCSIKWITAMREEMFGVTEVVETPEEIENKKLREEVIALREQMAAFQNVVDGCSTAVARANRIADQAMAVAAKCVTPETLKRVVGEMDRLREAVGGLAESHRAETAAINQTQAEIFETVYQLIRKHRTIRRLSATPRVK